jgi:hypothetical protein
VGGISSISFSGNAFKKRPRKQKHHTPSRQQDAVCLASSGIYVQNLIQFGNSSGSAVRFWGAFNAPPQFRVNAALNGRFDEKF